jgi:hypothetical protein
MNNFVLDVINIYKQNSIDFNYELECHLLHGIVFSDDKTFMFAIPCDSENPEIPVPIDNANCLFISMLAGDLKHGVGMFKDRFDVLAFKRQFKNSDYTRLYSYSKFYKKLK